MNSRSKGKRGELEFANLLRSNGIEARRGQQFCGLNGDADVVGLPGFHIEVKRVEKLNINNAMAQSARDASYGEKPIVAHRTNGERWKVTMLFDDWIEIVKAWEKDNERLYKDSQVNP